MGKRPVGFHILAVVCLLVLGWALIYLTSLPSARLSRSHTRFVQGAKVGWHRAQVIEHLGKPPLVIKTKNDYDYRCKDRSYHPPPKFPFEKEVLVYTDYYLRMYVYIGDDHRVTHVQMMARS